MTDPPPYATLAFVRDRGQQRTGHEPPPHRRVALLPRAVPDGVGRLPRGVCARGPDDPDADPAAVRAGRVQYPPPGLRFVFGVPFHEYRETWRVHAGADAGRPASGVAVTPAAAG